MKENKALPLVAMAYVTTKLLAILLFYKVIIIFSVQAAASTLIIPLWFCLGDVITEVYGYKISKALVWMSALCQLIFGWICYLVNYFPSAYISNINQAAYSEVASNLHKGATASFVAIVISGIVNAFILNKWKIKLNGNYFFMRSIGSTSIGEFVFTVLVYVIGFHGFTSLPTIFKFIMVSFAIKIVANPLMAAPINILANYLKKYENGHRSTKDLASNGKEISVQNKKTAFVEIESNGNETYFVDRNIEFIHEHIIGVHSKDIYAKSFSMVNIDEFHFLNWHTIQRPQYVIYLNSVVEIEVSNGEKRKFTSRDVVFFNDTIGKGHRTKVINPGQAIIIYP